MNVSTFTSLSDAQRAIEVWRVEYNTVRPHSSLGRRTPDEFTKALQTTEPPSPQRLTA
jgi:putative transposase